MLSFNYSDAVVCVSFNFGRLMPVHVLMMPALGLKCAINLVPYACLISVLAGD